MELCSQSDELLENYPSNQQFYSEHLKQRKVGGGGISYNDLHGKAPPEKLRISVVEVCEMEGKTVIKPVCKQAQ